MFGRAASAQRDLDACLVVSADVGVQGGALDVAGHGAVAPVDLAHQAFGARQIGRVGDAGSAEEHHAAVFVRLQERLRNVWAVGDELHYALSAKIRSSVAGNSAALA